MSNFAYRNSRHECLPVTQSAHNQVPHSDGSTSYLVYMLSVPGLPSEKESDFKPQRLQDFAMLSYRKVVYSNVRAGSTKIIRRHKSAIKKYEQSIELLTSAIQSSHFTSARRGEARSTFNGAVHEFWINLYDKPNTPKEYTVKIRISSNCWFSVDELKKLIVEKNDEIKSEKKVIKTLEKFRKNYCHEWACPECSNVYLFPSERERDNADIRFNINDNPADDLCAQCVNFCAGQKKYVRNTGMSHVYREVSLTPSGRFNNYSSSFNYSSAIIQEWFENGSIFVCHACDLYFVISLHRSNSVGHDFCPRCLQEERDRLEQEELEALRQVIRAHSFKPNYSGKMLGNWAYKMGVELEVELRSPDGDYSEKKRLNYAQKALELFQKNFMIAKDDGSLQYGFELVSAPATLEHHKKLWNQFFLGHSKRMTSYASGRCGIHVHVSRAPMTHGHIARIVKFINALGTRSFVERIAQRSESKWCKVFNKKTSDITNKGRLLSPRARYEAVNLCNENTIEFRIFRGTLNPASFMRCIEFTESVVLYCLPYSRSHQDTTNIFKFFDYILKENNPLSGKSNLSRYPNVAKLIASEFLKIELPAPKKRQSELELQKTEGI